MKLPLFCEAIAQLGNHSGNFSDPGRATNRYNPEPRAITKIARSQQIQRIALVFPPYLYQTDISA
jgi:hypothetical protein